MRSFTNALQIVLSFVTPRYARLLRMKKAAHKTTPSSFILRSGPKGRVTKGILRSGPKGRITKDSLRSGSQGRVAKDDATTLRASYKTIAGALGAIALAAAPTAASARGLCVDRDFSDSIRFDVTIGWDKPDPLDPNPSDPIVADPNEAAFLEEVRSFPKRGWRTPSFIWADTAVHVKIYDRGVIRCQVVYTRADIFVQDDDLDGFITRPISPLISGALDDALRIR